MMSEMPKPAAEHAKLKALAGTFTAEETIHPGPWDPNGGTATGTAVTRLDLDGFWMVTDYTQTRQGQVSYRGHGVFGWDPQANSYLMYWFDSMGSVPPGAAKGRWDGNRLVFAQQGPMGHGRYTYDFQGDGVYRFTIEHSADGKSWASFMEGTYRRK